MALQTKFGPSSPDVAVRKSSLSPDSSRCLRKSFSDVQIFVRARLATADHSREPLLGKLASWLAHKIQPDCESQSFQDLTKFDERREMIDQPQVSPKAIPDTKSITSFLKNFSALTSPAPDDALVIFSSHYLIRSLDRLGKITSCTWKPLCVACVVLATKMWEEQQVWLSEFEEPEMFPFLTLSKLTRLEMALVQLLNFELEFTIKDYYSTMSAICFNTVEAAREK